MDRRPVSGGATSSPRERGQLPVEVLLLVAERLGHVDHHADQQVAPAPALDAGHAQAPQPEHAPGLGAVGHDDLDSASVERLERDGDAEGGLARAHVQVVAEVVAVAGEARVGGDPEVDVEVAGGPAAGSGRAVAGQAEGVAVGDARGDVDRVGALDRPPALAPAVGARARRSTWPRPPHWGQGRAVTIWPSIDWRIWRTWPAPSHVGQVSGWVPGAAPVASQVSHGWGTVAVTGALVPNTACSKVEVDDHLHVAAPGRSAAPAAAEPASAAAEEGVEDVAQAATAEGVAQVRRRRARRSRRCRSAGGGPGRERTS